MGCFPSKLLKQSRNSYEQLNKRSQRRSNGLQEPPMSMKGGQRLLRPLNYYTRNTVAKTAKLYEEPGTQSNADVEHADPKLINVKKHKIDSRRSLELAGAETINVWELLAGLEEEAEAEGNQQEQTGKDCRVHTTEPTYHKFTVSAKDYVYSANLKSTSDKKDGRVVHTVEDYDAFLATRILLLQEGEKKDAAENTESHGVQTPQECLTFAVEKKEQGNKPDAGEHAELNSQHADVCHKAEIDMFLFKSTEMSSERGTEEHYLSAIEAPSFNLSRSGSLKEWLLGGSESMSSEQAGSSPTAFYPEMVAQFEQAMEQLMTEEDLVLQQILEKFN